MEGFINAILNAIQKIAQGLISLLPTSPFRAFIEKIDNIPFLEYLNFFLPIDICIPILVAWGSAISIFYLYSIILRWVKAID